MKQKIVVGAAVACVVGAGLLYASPYLALRNIAQAIDKRDADTVSDYVDFPALRESVKGQMLLKVQEQMQAPEMQNNLFAGLGQALAVGLVNQATETLVSPAGVMLMLERGKPGQPGDTPSAGAETAGRKARADYAVDYQGWSKVFVHPKNEKGGFIFRRDGLIGWKLTAIRIE